jgi:hypothetical protein
MLHMGKQHMGTMNKGKWESRQVEGNPRIQLEIFQLSQRVYTSQYGIKLCSSFCVLSRAKMQEFGAALRDKFCVKL